MPKKSAYRPKDARRSMRMTAVADQLVRKDAERYGLSADDLIEARIRGEDPVDVAARLQQEGA